MVSLDPGSPLGGYFLLHAAERCREGLQRPAVPWEDSALGSASSAKKPQEAQSVFSHQRRSLS